MSSFPFLPVASRQVRNAGLQHERRRTATFTSGFQLHREVPKGDQLHSAAGSDGRLDQRMVVDELLAELATDEHPNGVGEVAGSGKASRGLEAVDGREDATPQLRRKRREGSGHRCGDGTVAEGAGASAISSLGEGGGGDLRCHDKEQRAGAERRRGG